MTGAFSRTPAERTGAITVRSRFVPRVRGGVRPAVAGSPRHFLHQVIDPRIERIAHGDQPVGQVRVSQRPGADVARGMSQVLNQIVVHGGSMGAARLAVIGRNTGVDR